MRRRVLSTQVVQVLRPVMSCQSWRMPWLRRWTLNRRRQTLLVAPGKDFKNSCFNHFLLVLCAQIDIYIYCFFLFLKLNWRDTAIKENSWKFFSVGPQSHDIPGVVPRYSSFQTRGAVHPPCCLRLLALLALFNIHHHNFLQGIVFYWIMSERRHHQ